MLSSFEVEAIVQGFHVYKDIWNVFWGEGLKDQLQIIHSHINHWIAASVNNYLHSVYSSLDESTEIIVCDLFHTKH